MPAQGYEGASTFIQLTEDNRPLRSGW